MTDEKRLRALQNVQLFQAQLSRAFNKKVRPRDLQKGDMVLKEIKALTQDHRGNFVPKNWPILN